MHRASIPTLEGRPPSPGDSVHEPLVHIETDEGRRAFLARAEKSLAPDECLVKLVDLVGPRRSVRTVPKDARVKLVAQETPIVLRGGLTSLVSYYVAPRDGLAARETHYLGDDESHHYDIQMNVARAGPPARKPLPA